MQICVSTQLLALEYYLGISTGTCFATILITLISLQATTTCLPEELDEITSLQQ
jgi:hypothetical protein